MKLHTSLFALTVLAATQQAQAAVVHYSSDFSTAIDTGTAIVDSGGTLGQVFGDVSLVNLAAFGGTALVFNPNVSTYEQVELGLGAGYDNYHIEFDLRTQGLTTSDYAFTVLADTPTVQTLNFANCCSNTISMWSGSPSTTHVIGNLADYVMMHVSIDIDLANNVWTTSISGVGTVTAPFSSSGGDIESLRFSLAPALGGAGMDSSVYVGLDNLIVTSVVPLPAAAWLFGAGLLGLCATARRR